jgi:glycosyltransferase involved in cell wall biosynthesis|tara:strand:+ start:268 stop:1533 length:1266 start_codon:yes stop_codon:yes gene_type:complete
MPGLIIAAVRDLDPPAGGAEMSLATLLKGVSEPGPLSDADVLFVPCQQSPNVDPALLQQAWRIIAFQSDARGQSTSLTEDSEIKLHTFPLPIEDVWSGLAWRRRKKSGQPHLKTQRKHLKRANQKFTNILRESMKKEADEAIRSGLPVIGITQLHWSAGASEVFQELKIPYLVFVRDELQFIQSEIYRSSLENAAAVCCAGEGLGLQVSSIFSLNAIRNVRLPVDFEGRFGTIDQIEIARAAGLANRASNDDLTIPRIAIVGVTPEKGYEFYQEFLPYLATVWPEAIVDVYGGGMYAESLQEHDNVFWHGHTSVEEVFSKCDVHLLTVASTGSWGRVINEAGLFGVPSVSVDIGSQSEAVGDGGIVVSADAPLEDWVAALRSTYERRTELGELARQHSGIVDHRSSVAAFRSVIKEFSEGV